MKSKITLLLSIILLHSGCSSGENPYQSPLENSDTIRINNTLFFEGPDDNYQLLSASIEGNNLNLTIVYGGGCGEVFYDLLASDVYLDGDATETNVRLAFDDKDACEAGLELTLSFDLSQIQRANTDKVIIYLNKWDQRIEYNY